MIKNLNDKKIIAVKYNICPTCGYVADNWNTLVHSAVAQHKYFNELKRWGKEREEIHKCPLCGTYFKFNVDITE